MRPTSGIAKSANALWLGDLQAFRASVALGFFCFQALSTLRPAAGNASRWVA